MKRNRTIGVWLSSHYEREGVTREEIVNCFTETLGEEEYGHDIVLIVPYCDATYTIEEVIVKNGVIASWLAAGATIWEYVHLDGRGYVFFTKSGGVKLARIVA